MDAGEVFVRVTPDTADDEVVGAQELDVLIRQAEVLHDTLDVVSEDAVPVNDLDHGDGGGTLFNMDVAGIDALLLQALDHHLALFIGPHHACIRSANAHTFKVDGNVDRVSPGILLSLFLVHIYAVVTYRSDFHGSS